MCSISRYSAKFIVAPMSLLSPSRVIVDFAGTCSHVLLRRWMEAVCKAAKIAVSVEKLFSVRHFCLHRMSNEIPFQLEKKEKKEKY
jgi:hypothetical protein